MGCFNAACSISHLDIKVGDKCYFLILKPNQFQEETECSVLCYPDERYKLLCLPIVGEYDDYGSLQEIERDEHIEYLESYFGIPINSLIEIACESRDVYDSYSEKYNVFIENKDIMDYSAKLLDLMQALFKEEIHEKLYSYQYKNDNYSFQIEEDKYVIQKNDIEIASGETNFTHEFLRNFQKTTGVYLNIKNEKIFDLLHNISGCFVLKDIADSLMNNREFWRNGDFDEVKYWHITPSLVYHLGFKQISFDTYSITKNEKEYCIKFKNNEAKINGTKIRNIRDLQAITKIFNSDIEKLDKSISRIDLCAYDFKIGIMAKFGLKDDNFWEYHYSLGYLYEQSYSFRLNIPMMFVYTKIASNWGFEKEYFIAEKLYQIFYTTHNMMSPTCNASQTNVRDSLLMLYEVSSKWVEQKKKEYEEWD